ncbi:MAG: hypothetical protein CMI16_13270 [Opitutaceae bacterium]|nr:hypothetical protein [Opitutaceae bacterium]
MRWTTATTTTSLALLFGVVRATAAAATEEAYVFRFMDEVLPCTPQNARYLLTRAGLLDVRIHACNRVLRYCKGVWKVPEEEEEEEEAVQGAATRPPTSTAAKRVAGLRTLSGGDAHLNTYGQLAEYGGELAVIGGGGGRDGSGGESSAAPVDTAVAAPAVDDPLYYRQWAHHSHDVRRAWRVAPECDPRTLVVSIDTGADLDHPDLRHHSAARHGGGGGAGEQEFECNSLHPMFHEGCDASDSVPSKHGTGVASVVAARRNDGYGMAGVSDCRLLPVKLSSDGLFGSYEFASAVTYAVSVGATVITTSIVWATPTADMVAAVEWAAEQGVPIVAAAGNCNFGSCAITYPAGVPETLAVGAVDEADRIPSWQSLEPPAYGPAGRSVDVFAPGVDVLVAFRATGGDSHKLESGSSFAAPFVAGLVAQSVRPDSSAARAVQLVREQAQESTTKGGRRFSPCRLARAARRCSRADCPCAHDEGVPPLAPPSPPAPPTGPGSGGEEDRQWWLLLSVGLSVAVVGFVVAAVAVSRAGGGAAGGYR